MGSVTEPAPGEFGQPEPGVTNGGERDTSGDHGFFGQPRPLVHIFGVETTKLAPARFHTPMVALFFLSVAPGTAIPGQLAELYTVVNEATYFGVLGAIAIAIVLGGVLWLARKPVLRLMAGVR